MENKVQKRMHVIFDSSDSTAEKNYMQQFVPNRWSSLQLFPSVTCGLLSHSKNRLARGLFPFVLSVSMTHVFVFVCGLGLTRDSN